MKIIQSFSQFNNHQYTGSKLKGTEIYLLFYSFLFSYLTLKKYYGAVTMYCNQKAYDTFIKYIPYDKIIIKENKYTQRFFSAYKLDIIAEQNETFIHIDPDVFIFEDLFREYIDNQDKYDIIIQFVDTNNFNITYNKDNMYIYDDVCDMKKYKPIHKRNGQIIGNNFANGVVGMNMKVKDIYIKDATKVYNLIKKTNLSKLILGWMLEELTLYFTATRNNFKWYSIFGNIKKSISSRKFNIIGNIRKWRNYNYTHLWWDKKFIKDNIIFIKNKIKRDFKEQYYLIEEYEKYISDKNIFAFDHERKIIKF